MSRLKPQELRCLLLRAEGYSYKQICDETGFSYTKVNRCVNEGRKAFLDRVAGIESGAECERMAPLLSRLADGEATVEDMAVLRPHLRSCLACRATLREFREAPARAAAYLPLLATPHLLGRVLHRLERLFGLVGAHKTAAVVGVAATLAGGGAVAVRAIDHQTGRPPAAHERLSTPHPVPRSAAKPVAARQHTRSADPPRRKHHRLRKAPRARAALKARTSTPAAPQAPAPASSLRTAAPAPQAAPAPKPRGESAEFGP
jgi:hypothetical protein